MIKKEQGIITEPLKGIAQAANVEVWAEIAGEKKESIKTIVEIEKINSSVDHFAGFVFKIVTNHVEKAKEEGQEDKTIVTKNCIKIETDVLLEAVKMTGDKPLI